MSLSEMLEGWKNNLLPKEEMKTLIEAVHSERIAICEACEFHSKNQLSIRPDVHCTNCGCTLAAKTRCLSCSCPINKWEKK